MIKEEEMNQVITSNTTSIKLLSQGIEYMTKGMDELKESFKEFREEIKDGFVTKQEFENLKEDVGDLKRIKEWTIKIIVGSVILGLLALLGLNTL